MESKEVLGKKDLDRLEKQDKLLKLLREKRVDLFEIISTLDVYDYNCTKIASRELTEEEYKLLKEWLDGK